MAGKSAYKDYEIVVNIVEAKGLDKLFSKGLFSGSPDIYCLAKHELWNERTSRVKSKQPVWNASLRPLPIVLESNQVPLTLELWNKNILSTKTLIGVAHIDIPAHKDSPIFNGVVRSYPLSIGPDKDAEEQAWDDTEEQVWEKGMVGNLGRLTSTEKWQEFQQQTRNTSVLGLTGSGIFNEYLVFQLPICNLSDLEVQKVSIKSPGHRELVSDLDQARVSAVQVLDANRILGAFSNKVIGAAELEVGQVYAQKDHEIHRAWLTLATVSGHSTLPQ
eukprot:gene5202-6327_t